MFAADIWNTSSDLSRIQGALHAAAENARRIDTRRFEVDSIARIRAELVPMVYRAMDEAYAVLGDVVARYDRPSSPPPSEGGDRPGLGDLVPGPGDSGMFNCLLDDIVDAAADTPRQRIADIAFMARWELQRKRAAVGEAVQRGDDWQLIAECCSARRRVIKTTSGTERVLSEVEGLPSLFRDVYQTERQRAIDTRAAYHAFVVGLREAERRWQATDIGRCLRLIGTGVAQLVGRGIYEDLRVEDRRALRNLQTRIVSWLRDVQDPREGRRLLSEASATASLLMEVNRRPVLVEHDCELLEQLLVAVAEPATDRVAFFKRLLSVRGRDPELDRRIDGRWDLRRELWWDAVEPLLGQLRQR